MYEINSVCVYIQLILKLIEIMSFVINMAVSKKIISTAYIKAINHDTYLWKIKLIIGLGLLLNYKIKNYGRLNNLKFD